MNKLLVAILIILIYSNCLYCGWEVKDIGLSTFTELTDITFSDANNGWIVGSSGLVLHTINGGETWNKQFSNTNDFFTRVFFLDSLRGWICGNNSILKTVDGGQNWYQCNVDIGYGFKSIYILDDSTCWAVGEGGWVYHTENGYDWTQQSGSINLDFHDLDFATKDRGIIIGSMGDLHYIIDGKLSGMWSMLYSSDCYQNIFFVDSLVGWIGGYNKYTNHNSPDRCLLLRTEDAGEYWDYIAYAPASSFRNLYFLSRDEGWIVTTDGSIYHTNDGGHILTRQYNNKDVYWNSVYFHDNSKGWAVGSLGTLALYNPIIGINKQVPEESYINIFPNPVTDLLSIGFNFGKSKYVEIIIYNSMGSKVYEIYNRNLEIGEHLISKDISFLTSGIYFLKIIQNGESTFLKFIKI